MGEVRIGLIGAGVMGRIHARCLSRQVEGGRLMAVADLDREKAQRCAEEFGAASVYGDDDSLVADESIDAVLVCTPGNTHAMSSRRRPRRGNMSFARNDRLGPSGGGPGAQCGGARRSKASDRLQPAFRSGISRRS